MIFKGSHIEQSIMQSEADLTAIWIWVRSKCISETKFDNVSFILPIMFVSWEKCKNVRLTELYTLVFNYL